VVFEALEQLVRAFGDPALGLRVGPHTDQGTYGVIERAAAAADTLDQALEVLARHLRLANQAASLQVTKTDTEAAIRYTPHVAHPPAANDVAVVSLAAFLRRHCAIPVHIREVWVTQSSPSYAAVYPETLGAPVRFEMPSNAVLIDVEALSAPMRSRSPDMRHAFEARAARLAQDVGSQSVLAFQVKQRIESELARGPVSMGAVARRVRMSVATLRRKLDEEGTSYSEILDRVREELARHLIAASPRPLSEVSRMLGFSHVRAFTRAFHRWTGKSPSEIRNGIKPLGG
jgi:AraC-like DNA-binding protein